MPLVIAYQPFTDQPADAIFDLLLPIQRDEYGIAVTRQDQPDIEDIAAFYQTGLGNFWLALDRKKVIGTIALKDIGNQQVALRKMFVHKNFRGRDKGIARQLLEVALKWAKEKGVKDVYLGTTDKFLAAHRFYEKNNFHLIDKSHLPTNFPVMKVDSRFYHLRVD